MCTKTGQFFFTKGMLSYQSHRELWLGGSELQYALNYYHKKALTDVFGPQVLTLMVLLEKFII